MAERDFKQAAKHATKLVDAIANRNKPPELIGRENRFPEVLPLFPEDYDWREDERVFKALKRLWADTSVELWEGLARRHKKDARYCLTVRTAGDNAKILSIGDICDSLAYGRLVDVFTWHLPPAPGKESGPIYLDVGIGDKGLAEWRKERANKPLYELQIEVCENALRALAKEKDLEEKEKKVLRKKIEDEIAKLRSTKQPVMRKYNWFDDDYRLYTAAQAKEDRQELKREKKRSKK